MSLLIKNGLIALHWSFSVPHNSCSRTQKPSLRSMKPNEYRFYILGYVTILVPDEKGEVHPGAESAVNTQLIMTILKVKIKAS